MTIYWKYTEACNGKPCCGDCDKCPIEPIGEVTLKSRVELLKKLHDIMMNMNDEDCYFRWITWVPDEPTDEDFKSIALDTEEFQQVLQFFMMLFNEYREDEQKRGVLPLF